MHGHFDDIERWSLGMRSEREERIEYLRGELDNISDSESVEYWDLKEELDYLEYPEEER